MAARVEITPEAYAQAQELQEPIYSRVMAIVERLRDWPAVSGAKPLRGNLSGRYRIRTGDYRVQFHVQSDRIVVEKIGNRDRFYED
jgi:mRNA-degrading endonuclease RelE of RelBE toxin-antitoxin system